MRIHIDDDIQEIIDSGKGGDVFKIVLKEKYFHSDVIVNLGDSLGVYSETAIGDRYPAYISREDIPKLQRALDIAKKLGWWE
jgi:hypothetical protein